MNMKYKIIAILVFLLFSSISYGEDINNSVVEPDLITKVVLLWCFFFGVFLGCLGATSDFTDYKEDVPIALFIVTFITGIILFGLTIMAILII